MESSFTWEYEALINELNQGMEQAKQLQMHMWLASPSEARDLLLQRILVSYEKALLILNSGGSVGEASYTNDSSVSVDRSSKSEDLDKNSRDHQECHTSKKRKMQPIRTEQVKVSTENGLEGPTDDGYSWRKYGQKDILCAKHPRSYYRCTYRHVQNCWATKQVQRSDDDPNKFDITYRGVHTCNQPTNSVFPPASSELKHENDHNHEAQQQNDTLSNFHKNIRFDTEELGNKEMPAHFSFPSIFEEKSYFPLSLLTEDNHLSAYSSLFSTLDASESSYFSVETYQMESLWRAPHLQHSESEFTDIVSAHASTANSPIGSVEFSTESIDLNPNFPFHDSGFFT